MVSKYWFPVWETKIFESAPPIGGAVITIKTFYTFSTKFAYYKDLAPPVGVARSAEDNLALGLPKAR